MAHRIIIAITIIAAVQCAVIKDIPHTRIARSPCPTCDGLPPPPLLHTQNWSGLARTADGLQNAVFSGAAAAAEPGAQNAGEAFSLASSAVNHPRSSPSAGQSPVYGTSALNIGVKGNLPNSYKGNYESTQSSNGNYNLAGNSYRESSDSHTPYQSGNTKDFRNQVNSPNTGFDSVSSSGQIGSYGANNNGHFDNVRRGDVDNENTAFGRSKSFESQRPSYLQSQPTAFNVNRGEESRNELKNGISSGQYENGNYNANGRSPQPRESQDQQGFGSSQSTQRFSKNQFSGDSLQSNYNGRNDFGSQKGYQQPSTQQASYSGLESSAGSSAGHHEAGANNFDQNKHQIQQGLFGRSGRKLDSENSSEEQWQNEKHDGTPSILPNNQSSDAGSALKGALDLSSQGLQAARLAECSTCGKNSYAFSKAKSYSGSAIALSIGG